MLVHVRVGIVNAGDCQTCPSGMYSNISGDHSKLLHFTLFLQKNGQNNSPIKFVKYQIGFGPF